MNTTRPSTPPIEAVMVVMTDHWQCPLTGEDDHPLALALYDDRHPDTSPLLLSPAGLKAALDQGLDEITTALARRRAHEAHRP